MKLKLRKFHSVIVLHVSGLVQPHDVDVLSAGAAKISNTELPLILNMETADLTDEAVSSFESLYDKLSQIDRVFLIVSPILPAADASTFEEALSKSKNHRKDVILRCLRLEEKLKNLEDEQEALAVKIKELEEKGKSHFEFLREKNITDYMLFAMEDSIKSECERIESYQGKMQVNPKLVEKLEELKSEIMELFKEKGVPLS